MPGKLSERWALRVTSLSCSYATAFHTLTVMATTEMLLARARSRTARSAFLQGSAKRWHLRNSNSCG